MLKQLTSWDKIPSHMDLLCQTNSKRPKYNSI